MSTTKNTEETKREILKKAGKIAKITGLAGLTTISPPIGLALAMKNTKRGAVAGVIAGVGLSFISALTGTVLDYAMHDRKVYDSPKITLKTGRTFGFIDMANSSVGIITSPLLFYSSSTPCTELVDGEKSYIITGRDAIQFNKEEGNYVLNFEPERKFLDSKKRLVSVRKAEQKLEELRASGDVLGARKAAADYERIRSEYEMVREHYASAIEKMNSELKGLSRKLEEK